MQNNVFRWFTQYSKYPPKIANQESGKIASPTFAQSFCGELCCSISPKSPEYLFLRAAEIEFQNIPRKWPNKNP